MSAFALFSAVKGGVCDRNWDHEGYALLMSPNKDETAVHRYHCRGNIMAVRVRKVLPIPQRC